MLCFPDTFDIDDIFLHTKNSISFFFYFFLFLEHEFNPVDLDNLLDDIPEEEIVDDPQQETVGALPMARKSVPKKGKVSKKFRDPIPCGIGKCTVSELILY